jgi:hypothetical protein
VSSFSVENEARLLELIRQELMLFSVMRGRTEKQAEQIKEDDVAAFENSLGDRQEIIEKINGLHQETDGLMQSYSFYRSSADTESPGELDSAISQLKDSIAECAALNDIVVETAKERALYYTERIGKLSLSRQSLGKYQQELPNTPQMFDKKM